MTASQYKYPLVLSATGYPLHADAFRSYLTGFYQVVMVKDSHRQNGLSLIEQYLSSSFPVAILVDDTFPYRPDVVAQTVKSKSHTCGLICIDSSPNIFKVMKCFDQGYTAYLFAGDHLATSLRLVVDMARHGERFMSPGILELYERYTIYRGLLTSLPKALRNTFKLMAEGLTVQEMVAHTGLRCEIIYRHQFRLRRHFGVETNKELVELMQSMFSNIEPMELR